MPISVTCYSIIMDVELVIEAAKWNFVYFITSKLMFLASYSFILWCDCLLFSNTLL